MSEVCLICNSTEYVNSWANEHNTKAYVCCDCEEKIADNMENALLKRCPAHFSQNLRDAIGDFYVTDRETDMLDVVWNLADCIKGERVMADLFCRGNNPTDEEKNAIVWPTPLEFFDMMEDYINSFHPKSPRYEENPQVMDWNFVFDLFEVVA